MKKVKVAQVACEYPSGDASIYTVKRTVKYTKTLRIPLHTLVLSPSPLDTAWIRQDFKFGTLSDNGNAYVFRRESGHEITIDYGEAERLLLLLSIQNSLNTGTVHKRVKRKNI